MERFQLKIEEKKISSVLLMMMMMIQSAMKANISDETMVEKNDVIMFIYRELIKAENKQKTK